MEMTLNVKITGLENLVAVLERITAVSQVPSEKSAELALPIPTPIVPMQTASGDCVQAPQVAPVAQIAPANQPQVAAVPVSQTAQVVQAPVESAVLPQATPAVPTTAQSYTQDQLALAASALVDAGRLADLQALLAAFGIQALTQLPPEHYGNFATQLRAMGAKI